MTDKAKKIIAREGLIFLGFLFLGIITGKIIPDTKYSDLLLLRGCPIGIFSFKNMAIIISAYSLYLSIHFIIWAIGILRKK